MRDCLSRVQIRAPGLRVFNDPLRQHGQFGLRTLSCVHLCWLARQLQCFQRCLIQEKIKLHQLVVNQSGVAVFARRLAHHLINKPKVIAQAFDVHRRCNFVTLQVIGRARKRGLPAPLGEQRSQFLHDGFDEIVVDLISRARKHKPTHRPHVDRNIARLRIGHRGRQTWGSHCPAVACRAIESCRAPCQISRVHAVRQTARAG